MEKIVFDVTKFVKEVTLNIRRQIDPMQVQGFEKWLKEFVGIPHLDGFSLFILYRYSEDFHKDPDYLQKEENIITDEHILNSIFFNLLVKNLKKIENKNRIEDLEDMLQILNKALKIFGLVFFDDLDKQNIPVPTKNLIRNKFQTNVIDTIYVHSKDIDIHTVRELIRKLTIPIGSSKITTDSSRVLSILSIIKHDQDDRIFDHLLDLLAKGIIPPDSKDQFRLLLKYKGRIEKAITWGDRDWKLYWLIFFFERGKLIEYISGQEIYDFILFTFLRPSKKPFNRKDLASHVSRSLTKITKESPSVYLKYYKRLEAIFTSFNII